MPDWKTIDERARVYLAPYPVGRFGQANCLAVGLGDGELALVSPPGGHAGPALLEAIAERGRVTALVAPNGFHRLGLPGAQARFPEATVYAAPGALDRVGKVTAAPPRPLDALQAALPDGVEILVPPHLKRPDTFVRVRTPAGAIWYINDLVNNLPSLPEPAPVRWMFQALGFRPGLVANRFGCRNIFVGDRPAFARWFRQALEDHPPAVIVTGHGPAVRDPDAAPGLADDVEQTLR